MKHYDYEKYKFNKYFGFATNSSVRNYLLDQPVREYYDKRSMIVQSCGITTDVLRNWMIGLTPIPAEKYELFKKATQSESKQ